MKNEYVIYLFKNTYIVKSLIENNFKINYSINKYSVFLNFERYLYIYIYIYIRLLIT